MKKVLFLIIVLGTFLACQDDENVLLNVPTEFKQISFDPVPGGAVMRYYLPDDTEIFGVQVEYLNAWGERQAKKASYLSDSLLLDGFTEEQSAVPAKVTFFDRNMVMSEPIELTFATQKSATVAVFDNLTVNPYWGGFNVTYSSPSEVSGMIHVFYIGTNPTTHKPDSILLSSTPIMEGGDTLNFVLQQVMDSVDVVVRTDSYSGKRVKQKIIKGLPALTMDTLLPADFTFKFMGEIQENEEHQFGQKYLFDGDKKGTNYRNNRLNGEPYKYATFIAGPSAFGERFIVDLGAEKVPAAVNLYAYIYWGTSYPTSWKSCGDPWLDELWKERYYTKLPAKVKLYGTNEDPETIDLKSCARLYELDEGLDFDWLGTNSWAKYTDDRYLKGNMDLWGWNGSSYFEALDSEIESADPVVLKMLCNYTGAQYRYLIFVVEDTYYARSGSEDNNMQYITFNELEVCVKAEN